MSDPGELGGFDGRAEGALAKRGGFSQGKTIKSIRRAAIKGQKEGKIEESNTLIQVTK